MEEQLITRDLIHVTKGMIHVLMGNRVFGQTELDKVVDANALPDFDDISNDVRATLYKIAWNELYEEGYYANGE